MKITIAGGSGQVGRMLARHFHQRGDDVVTLSRSPRSELWRTVKWDGMRIDSWVAELEGADVCINLAGRSVNCRYSPANRQSILESRTHSTQVIGEAIAGLSRPPYIWLNASTATIYRHAQDRAMDEDSGELGGNEQDAPATWRFSIRVAKAWEDAFFAAATPRTRKVALRSAMTFSPDPGGVFDELLRLVRLGMGGRQGSGEQYVSWIHEADFLSAVDFIIRRDDLSGTVNVSSPGALPNVEFMGILRHAWGIRFGMNVPNWLVEAGALMIRTESELILKSRWVIPTRLTAAGFHFRFPDWSEAARDLVSRWKTR